MSIQLDEGFFFGIGAFETIAVTNGHPVLLDFHLDRLNKALAFLKIDKHITRESILGFLDKSSDSLPYTGALKLSVSSENTLISKRENPYTKEQYKKGFSLLISKTMRNETSPLTYIKSLNYAENILEKRRAASLGYDEPLFLNSRGDLAEGATTNIFLRKGNHFLTPAIGCGLLNGTIRSYILDRYPVEEAVIYPSSLADYDEVFVTNSLMGIMSVKRIFSECPKLHGIRSLSFPSTEAADAIRARYFAELENL